MFSPFGGGLTKRAREELEAALLSICDRIDALESLPEPTNAPQKIQAALEAIRGRLDERLGALETRFQGVESDVEDQSEKIKLLTFGVEEGIQRTKRAEMRIHATVKRARKELAEHGYESPGLEVEAAELRLVDGGGSADGTMPALPAGVEPPIDEASSVKGVSAEALRRVRGF